MKASEDFKTAISEQLTKMGNADSLFAKSLQKEGKNIDDCVTYVLNTVKKSGCTAFTDSEIYGMAAHYYDEDNLEIGKPIDCKVIHSSVGEAKKEEVKRKIQPKKVEQTGVVQGSLF